MNSNRCAHYQFLFCDPPIFCTISDVPYIWIYFWCTILLYLLWCTNIMYKPWCTFYLSLLLMYPIIAFTLMYLIFALFSDTPNIWFIYSDVPNIHIFLWHTQILSYIFWCTYYLHSSLIHQHIFVYILMYLIFASVFDVPNNCKKQLGLSHLA